MLTILIIVLAVIGAGFFIFLNQAKFGRLPSGERQARIKNSPNYRSGRFQNLIPTSNQTEGVTFVEMMAEYLRKKERLTPAQPLPGVKTDLSALFSGSNQANRDLSAPEPEPLVWFGHSSFLMRLGGRNILVDPVFSDYASPFFFITRAFSGANLYSAVDLPAIDYLLISHDHWDHLDYQTVMALKDHIGRIVCGLGVGEHFERWGFPPEKIIEGDWYDRLELEPGLTLHFLPARHFSGRGLFWNKSLWTAFALEPPGRRIFYSGDTGPGPHLADIGRRFDGFDLAIIEDGQYDRQWADIHLSPEEAGQAAVDLKARALLPVHNGKFRIANHSWDDPFIRLSEAQKGRGWQLVTPLIGETIDLTNLKQDYKKWWEELK